MGKGAIIIGAVLVLFGIWLLFQILSSDAHFILLMYPLFSIGIGIALIILNKEEDKIEERKDLKSKKSRK